jgi:hypothetical protein
MLCEACLIGCTGIGIDISKLLEQEVPQGIGIPEGESLAIVKGALGYWYT